MEGISCYGLMVIFNGIFNGNYFIRIDYVGLVENIQYIFEEFSLVILTLDHKLTLKQVMVLDLMGV